MGIYRQCCYYIYNWGFPLLIRNDYVLQNYKNTSSYLRSSWYDHNSRTTLLSKYDYVSIRIYTTSLIKLLCITYEILFQTDTNSMNKYDRNSYHILQYLFLHVSSLKIDDGTTSISSPATSGYTERFGESKIHILSLSSVCIWGIETLICIYLEIKKDTKWV